MPFIYTALSTFASYKVCNLFTHPNSKIWQNFPKLRIKRVELLPSLRIFVKGRVIHLHHWFNFTILLGASVFVTGGILDSWVTRGALLGGIFQGLSIPSARKIIYRQDQA